MTGLQLTIDLVNTRFDTLKFDVLINKPKVYLKMLFDKIKNQEEKRKT